MGESFDQTTLQPPDASLASDWCDGLTIAFHPDADRIGERVRLDPGVRSIELSRATPSFDRLGGGAPRPLADRCVSRRPITLRRSGAGLLLEAPPAGVDVRVDGAPVTAEMTLSADQIVAGVVLELAKRVIVVLHRLPSTEHTVPGMGIIGRNPTIDELRRNILRVADLPVPVLIRGETGSGKELVANAIHRASDRSRRAFVSLNMAAIPPSTAASELFGHVKGAFTGAVADSPGYFVRAQGGTLFLDEIGATPLEVQALLLRALDSNEIQPVGATAPRTIDVRLVAATDADLEAASDESSFSAALLHRLESFQLFVPPLRARRDDIGRLLVYFLERELATIGELDRLSPRADDTTYLPVRLVAQLIQFDWPGNVRQLRNVVRQLVIQNRGSERVPSKQRLAELLGAAPPPDLASGAREVRPASGEPQSLTEEAIIEALRACEWQVNDAASRLGVSRSTLYARVGTIERIRKARDLTAEEIEACMRDCSGDVASAAQKLEVSRRALSKRMKDLGLR